MKDPVELVRASVRAMAGYVPGWQPGPGEKFIKLNTNENPYPPSERVREAVLAALNKDLRLYPNPESRSLKERAAALYGLQPQQVLCGNGSDEVLAIIMRTFIGEKDAVCYYDPSYSLYPVLAEIAAARNVVVDLPRDISGLAPPRQKAKVFFLTNPNAPYGFGFPRSWVEDFLRDFDGVVVADEAYVDFGAQSALPLLPKYRNLIVVRSLSKSYALAGMRLGLALGAPEVIAQLAKVKDSYNLDRLTQAAGAAALEDQEYFREQLARVVASREWFAARLRELRFTVLPSVANFIFAVPPPNTAAADIYRYLFDRGILVRYFDTPKLADGIRISIGTDADMEALVRTLKDYPDFK